MLSCLACGSGTGKKAKNTPLHFDLPTLPMTITSQADANDFLVRHYWDQFPFSDTLCIHQDNFAKPLFTQFAGMVLKTSTAQGQQGVRNLMQRAAVEKPVYMHFAQVCRSYFFDPNSPYLNEDIYRVVLEDLVASPLLTAAEQEGYRTTLEMVNRNRVGQLAQDLDYIAVEQNFPYTENPQNVQRLYALEAPFLLVFFNNPGCPNCKEVIQQLLDNPYLTALIQKKTLVVLSLYPDAELEAWQDYLPNLPAQWINAYNPNTYVKDNDIYDLKAIPTLYLLDREKKVLVKDGTSALQIQEAIEKALQ